MTVTCRRMNAEDLPQVIALTLAAFVGDDGESRRQEIARGLTLSYEAGDVMKYEHGFVAEEAGRILAKGQVLDLQMRVGAVSLRVGGLHAITTANASGARSLFLPLVRYAVDHVRAAGFDLGLGFTQHARIFRLIGGATVAADYDWELPVAASPSGAPRFWRMRDEELPRLLDLTARANASRVLSLVRDASLWHQLERRPSENWLSDTAYVGVRRGPHGLEVRDVGAENDAAYVEVLAFLGGLAKEAGLSRIFGEWPPDHPLVLASGREAQERRLEDGGCMAAILDVPSFVEKVAPELQRRARSRISITCGDHVLHVGDQGPIVSLRGSAELLLRLVLGSGEPTALVRAAPGAELSGPAETITELFGPRHPHTGLVDRW